MKQTAKTASKIALTALLAILAIVPITGCEALTGRSSSTSSNSSTSTSSPSSTISTAAPSSTRTASNTGTFTASDLSGLLPSTITDYVWSETYNDPDSGYELSNDTTHTGSSVSNIEIVKQQVNDKSAFVECAITLDDDYLTRTIHADLNLTRYDDIGWQIESWSPYATDEIVPKITPDASAFENVVRTLGVSSFTQQDVSGDPSHPTITYAVNEVHTYCTITGTIDCTAALNQTSASNDEMGYYGWFTPTVDSNNLVVDWSPIVGSWFGQEQSNPGDVFLITITSVDAAGNMEGYGTTAYPCVGPGTSTYLGYYKEVPISSFEITARGFNLTINGHTNSGTNHVAEITFTPDSVSCDEHSFDGNLFTVTAVSTDSLSELGITLQ